jgi:glucans biosynthesis protein
MQRRAFLLGGGLALPLLAMRADWIDAATAPATAGGAGPFDGSTVSRMARELAAKPFQAPDTNLPKELANLNYDQYRSIRFDPARSLWRGSGLPFEVQFFHRGFLYKQRVDIFEVADGAARPVGFNPDLFSYGLIPRPEPADLGFAGFRVHAPFNRPDYADEVCVFLGASYFRAVAKGQGYGLSARGLAINTADPKGEEFPTFRSFWLERPQAGTAVLVVHALLDSPSCAAAFRFTIRPGEQTLFDTELTLFPRTDIAEVGLAPLTSMFMFDANDRAGIDDYRSAVHDSDALAMWTGRGERLFRPLQNPQDLQISVFGDTSPRGFGLLQRKRAFQDYDDLEAHYERRPTAWVEPIGDAGAGAVMLVEIPTKGEVHDNIVAFWRPHDPLKATSQYQFTYRLHWCVDEPVPSDLAKVVDTRIGAGKAAESRIVVIELKGGRLGALPADAKPKFEATAGKGTIKNPVAEPNPETGGWRVAFELDTGGEKSIELRASLADDRGPLAETWVYRWTA